jgi:hypothetical protein
MTTGEMAAGDKNNRKMFMSLAESEKTVFTLTPNCARPDRTDNETGFLIVSIVRFQFTYITFSIKMSVSRTISRPTR